MTNKTDEKIITAWLLITIGLLAYVVNNEISKHPYTETLEMNNVDERIIR